MKKKVHEERGPIFLVKNTCILIIIHCILIFAGSPRKKSLMDSNFSRKKDLARLSLFENQQSFWQQHIFYTFQVRFLTISIFLLNVFCSPHPSDSVLSNPISFLSSTLSSPRIPNNVLFSHIYFSLSALSNPHSSDNTLSSPIFFFSRMFSTPRILNSTFSSPIFFLFKCIF